MNALALPVFCTEADLGSVPFEEPVVPAGAASVRVLVRRDGHPLGFVDLPVTAPRTREALVAGLSPEARAALARPPADPPLGEAPASERLSVVVCTRERPETLRQCLEALRLLRYPDLEIVVVDNAPRSDETQQVVEAFRAEDPRFRYERESRPGLSRARNHGLRSATGDVVAFTDDDVRVDPLWLHGLVQGFSRRADVTLVTGIAAAAALDSPLEAYFDDRVAWATVRPPQVYDMTGARGPGALYPFAAGMFGAGANFAVRRDRMVELGGFDENLGAGAPTRGGEDLDAFVRVLLGGGAIAVEPAAVVWHHHRSELAALQSQMYGYGTGLTAFYAKLLADRRTRGALLKVVPHGLLKLARTVLGSRTRGSSTSSAVGGQTAPKGLMVRELLGMAAGPALYWRARTTA